MEKLRLKFFIWFGLCLLFPGASTFAQAIDWPMLKFTKVVTNTLTYPIGITHAGDGSGRLFVIQQRGQILIVQNGSVQAQPFLDISNRVLSAGAEQGLLGLAFPPGFSTNNHFYVDYTRQPDGAIVISRFFLTTTNASVADTNSEQVLLVISKPSPSSVYNNHNAGQLAFGPDGYLYIGVGDGGREDDPLNEGQSTNKFYGKILRIDVESGVSPYAIPPNNPFVSSNNYVHETWAYGLRNPWRFSFDDQTGDLYIGDVGQNSYEEIDFQPAGSPGGQNYGWRIMEGYSNFVVPFGFTNFAALTLPVAVYSHASLSDESQGAVIGGYVYRGPNMPRMNGVYFYGDFITGWVWGLKEVGTNWQSQALVNPPYSAGTNFWISTFGEDDQGQLYLADYYRGIIYQIQDSGQVWAPAFSPAGGTINSNTVVITCLTTNAEIHFTTNGIDPTLSDPIVASGESILVVTGITNKARAFRLDLSPSAVTSAIYTDQVGTPIFSPNGGTVTNGTLVTISTITPGATIYYTTDGTTPTTNSLMYPGPVPTEGSSFVLKALSVENGYSNSIIATATYSETVAATPVFVPGSGPIANGTSISISCATPNSTIYYTLDGTTPTTNSSVYSGPIALNGGITLNAMATVTGYQNSAVESVFYQLDQVATPAFTPSSGPITNGTPVAITCATPASTIYYTLDGSTPTTLSSIYSVPLVINGNTTLNAIATANQYSNSLEQSVFYSWAQVSTPVFNPSGPVNYKSTVSISCATPGSTIYYTLDGSTPTTDSTVYSSPLVLTNPITLSAIAYAPGTEPSEVQSSLVPILDLKSTVVTTIAGTTHPGFTNGFGFSAAFSLPYGVCVDKNENLYIADQGNNVIRKISPSGLVTTFAGTGTAGSQIGSVTNTQFRGPTGVCVDNAGNVFVADNGNCRICKIGTDGTVSVLAGLCYLWQLAPDSAGNIYAGSEGTVQKISPNSSVVQIGGVPTQTSGSDWNSSVGPNVDNAGNVYAATQNKIWEITADEVTQLFAGNGYGFTDGSRQLSLFIGPLDVSIDSSTNLFIADQTRVRRISLDGWVSTMAGNGIFGYQDGLGGSAEFNGLASICVDTNGNIFVADSGNNCIREISPDTAGIGIADWWQLKYFGYVGINPNSDPNTNGMTAYEDFWAGLNPTNPASVFRIESANMNKNGTQVSWDSVLGKNYIIQWSSDLVTWNTIGNPVPGNGSLVSTTDTTPGQQNRQRFYRVLVDF